MKKNNFTISTMYCCKCGKRGLPIARKIGQEREPGHLKRLYCIYCNDEVNHAEIRFKTGNYNLEDFLLEYKYNNFDDNGNRKEPYRIFKENLKKEGII